MAVLSPDAVISKVQRLVMDTALESRDILTLEQYDDAIQWAVAKFSGDSPLVLQAEFAGAGSEWILISDDPGWVAGKSHVQSVEYPAAAVGAGYEPILLTLGDEYEFVIGPDGGSYVRLLTGAATVGTDVRVTFTTVHTMEEGGDQTIRFGDLEAFYSLCAARACLILGSREAGRTEGQDGVDDINRSDGQSRYERQRKLFLDEYNLLMGLSGDPATGGASAPVMASARRHWDTIPVLERAASRIIRGRL